MKPLRKSVARVINGDGFRSTRVAKAQDVEEA